MSAFPVFWYEGKNEITDLMLVSVLLGECLMSVLNVLKDINTLLVKTVKVFILELTMFLYLGGLSVQIWRQATGKRVWVVSITHGACLDPGFSIMVVLVF